MEQMISDIIKLLNPGLVIFGVTGSMISAILFIYKFKKLDSKPLQIGIGTLLIFSILIATWYSLGVRVLRVEARMDDVPTGGAGIIQKELLERILQLDTEIGKLKNADLKSDFNALSLRIKTLEGEIAEQIQRTNKFMVVRDELNNIQKDMEQLKASFEAEKKGVSSKIDALSAKMASLGSSTSLSDRQAVRESATGLVRESNQFVAGNYSVMYGNKEYPCAVSVATLNDGRHEVNLLCNDYPSSGWAFSVTWATGPIDGHPFEFDLLSAKIDKIPGYRNYCWGKVEQSHSNSFGGFYTGYIVGARQIDNKIVLSCYGTGNSQQRGITLVKK